MEAGGGWLVGQEMEAGGGWLVDEDEERASDAHRAGTELPYRTRATERLGRSITARR